MLSITNGGSVSSSYGRVGFDVGAVGLVTVDGANSTWANSYSVSVGTSGTGTLSITHGGSVSNTNARVGSIAGSVGAVTVDGAGSKWINNDFLSVGSDGTGTLSITQGGSVSSTNAWVGSGADAVGSVKVDGVGSKWSNSDDLVVGSDGTGTLSIAHGGSVSNTKAWVGSVAGSVGAVTVDGAGSKWINSDTLIVGSYGVGTLNVTNGGSVSNTDGWVGAFAGSAGAVTVDGANSTWTNRNLYIGSSGTGTLAVTNGGSVSSDQGVIGIDAGSVGMVMIDGPNSTWNSNYGVYVGLSGTGALTIANGGRVSAAYAAISAGIGSIGTLNIGAAPGETPMAAGVLDTPIVIFGAETGAINFNHTNTDYEFKPNVSGTGSVNQLSGTTILTGANTYTGGTDIRGGRLVVDGSIVSASVVHGGGTLAGNGTVGSVTVKSGGTLSPGNSIGTLTVNGDLVVDGGAHYLIETDPAGTASDLVHVTGTATLGGGSVSNAGGYNLRSTYTILTADQGLSGSFSNVTSNFAFLDPTLTYDANNVYLNLKRNGVKFIDAGMTRNQIATAGGLEGIGLNAGNPLYDAFVQLPDDKPLIRGALEQLSGEIHASVKSALIEDSRFVREAAVGRLRTACDDVDSTAAAGVSTLNSCRAVWGYGFGAWGSTDSDGNAAKLTHSTGGFLIGADTTVLDTWRVGALAGYSRTDFDVNDRYASGSSDNYHLGLYGGTSWGKLGFRSGLAYSWNDTDTSRSVDFPGFSDRLKGGYRSGTFQVFGDLGYRIDTSIASFEPFASLAYVNLNTGSFTELGGAAALHANSQNTNVTFATLGLRASTRFEVGGMAATAHGSLGWQHAFGDTTPLSTHAFAASNAFTVAGGPIAQDAALVEAGFEVNLTRFATLGVFYNGRIASSSRQNGVKANLNVRF